MKNCLMLTLDINSFLHRYVYEHIIFKKNTHTQNKYAVIYPLLSYQIVSVFVKNANVKKQYNF